MWGQQYDENLHNNPFFQEIITNHSDLVIKTSQENWVICVPRAGITESSDLTTDTILDHILIPRNSEETWYTLSKKQVSVRNKEITSVDHVSKTSQILFEETFYIQGLKYLVFCIHRPLFINRPICDDHTITAIDTLHDCIDFLWSENLSHVLIKIQRLCASFVEQNSSLAVENLQTQKDLIGSLYSQCLQIVLKNRSLNDNCDTIKIAVETYMQSCLDRALIKAINTVTCFSDATLNKIVRNSSDLKLKDINISAKFCDIITNAKSELYKINNYVTILDKLHCLKLTFNNLYSTNISLTSDDILQILVFLIVKLNISNWTANLVYLTHFQFSSLNVSNENNFLITSLEAALEFIKSDEFIKTKSSQQTSNLIFQTIITNDLTQLQGLLNYKKASKIDINLCHPLCDCDNCTKLDSSHNNNSTVNEKGQSLLTFATILGRPNIVEFLISIDAEVNSRDYFGKTPLHYACSSGYQDVLLILLNCKADINVRDNDGNSPLHLACNDGHDNCVKALFYTSKIINIDCINKFGDTPLNLAIRWNYVGIVKILLENNASVNIPNKKNQLPVHLAQTYYIEHLLKKYHGHMEPLQDSPLQPSASTKNSHCKDHGIRPAGVEQLKKIDLLLKSIENNDFPLTCFYLGFPNGSTNYDFQSKCHPLCNCEKCDDWESNPSTVVDRINVNTCNIDGFTPLHFAAKYGRIELLRILLDSGALPNLKTYKTLQTPLHLACIYQRLHVVRELVKCDNFEMDAQDYKGNTPLYYACVKNDTKIVEVLSSNGASCDVQNYQGNSIIKEVKEKSLFGICNLLKDQNEESDFL